MTKEQAIILMSFLPSRPDYDMWIKVISAIGNEFSESDALDIILSRWGDEKPNETLHKLRNRLSKFTIGTLIYYARTYGYSGNEEYNYNNTNNYTRHKFKPRVTFSEYKQENCYHNPYNVSQYFDDVKYPVAVNTNVINKNISVSTGEIDNFNNLVGYFSNSYLSKSELISHISSGYPVIFSHFAQDYNAEYIQSIKGDYWLYSKMFAVDIEESISLEQAFELDDTKNSLFIYTTCNHTDEENRFRIVFDMKGVINDPIQYSYVVKQYIEKYNADVACSNVNRAFYGNDEAIVYVYDNKANSFVNYYGENNG